MKKKNEDPDHVVTFHVSIADDEHCVDKRYVTLDVTYRKHTKLARALRDARTEHHRTSLRMARRFGIESFFDTLPSDDGTVKICWLEYRDEDDQWIACQPDIDIGDQVSLMRRGMALLEKMGSVIARRAGHPNRPISDETFADPDVVVSALRQSRMFTEIERHELDRRGYWIGTAAEWDRVQDGCTEVA
jgi:hypothetical protein